ncbi:hypothetical protein HDU98_008918 [Podochytrium sp. JEL0797]|nr:hypothetical protein HDU98_008918 [Podochytrium sp. JEL0797]
MPKLLQTGCIAACVSDSQLDTKVQEYVTMLAEGGPDAQSTIKQLISVVSGSQSDLAKQKFVKGVFECMLKSQEAAYGMKAFLAKEKPDWVAFGKLKNSKL